MQENEANAEGIKIDLLRLVFALLKKSWIIVIVAVVFGMGTYFYSATAIAPTYRTSFTAYVNNRLNSEGMGSTSAGDLNASIGLTYLYEKIIASRSVLTDAAAKCGHNYSYSQLSGMVTTSITQSAALITVNVVSTDPEQAMELAEAIAEVAPDHVARVVEGSSMRIVDPPLLPTGKYGPNNTKNAVSGAMIGCLLAAAVILVIELLDDKVRDSDDLEDRYQIVVIGNIPDTELAEKSRGNYGYKRAGGNQR